VLLLSLSQAKFIEIMPGKEDVFPFHFNFNVLAATHSPAYIPIYIRIYLYPHPQCMAYIDVLWCPDVISTRSAGCASYCNGNNRIKTLSAFNLKWQDEWKFAEATHWAYDLHYMFIADKGKWGRVLFGGISTVIKKNQKSRWFNQKRRVFFKSILHIILIPLQRV